MTKSIKNRIIKLGREIMEIKLNLYGAIGIFDKKTIIAPSDQKITIKLVHRKMNDVLLFAKVKGIGNIEVQNDAFELENRAGCYEITIYATKNGEVLKEYQCEPLTIKELVDKHEFVGHFKDHEDLVRSIINEQTEKIAELHRTIVKLEEKIDNVLEVVKELNEIQGEIE